jgi:tetratricopeptide (TPR) repeat protein
MRIRPALLLLLVGLAPFGAARAGKPAKMKSAARSFYEAAQALYDKGRFRDAAVQFQNAYDEDPVPAFIYNACQSLDKAGDRAQAIACYKRYLGFKESKEDAAQLAARLEVLEREEKAATAPVAAPAPAPAAPRHTPLPYKEPVTGLVFDTFLMVDGKEYVLVGVGTRKVIGFKVYAMALYIEDEAARKGFTKLAGQAGGADAKTLQKSGLVPGFIIQGEFGKHAIMRFTRAVSAADQRKSYREALGDDATDKATPEVRKAAEDFLALFSDDVKDGDVIEIQTDADDRVGIAIGGKKKWGPRNARIAHDVWDIWLGANPINADLKAALIDRVDTLGR